MDVKRNNEDFINKAQVTPWGEIGYITYKRTYARRLKEDDPESETEEFWQTIKRELDASDKQLKVGFTDDEKLRYAETRLGLKWSVAGRFMWQLGTKTVDRLGLPSLQNCAGVVVDEPIRPFTWAFEMLMLGSGVGYNIQKHNVYQLPKIKKKVKIERQDNESADFIVPDTREGWVKLLAKVLKCHFYGNGEGFTYSTQLIRGKGATIKGFGGTASGPEELCWGLAEISKIINGRSGKKLRPIDCLDIMNIIGFIVVAGNVRRSAQLAIGDYDDIEFLTAKRWDLSNIPRWRGMSNNSVAAPEDLSKLPNEFWDTYNEGEPYGLINLELSKEIGRTGDFRYPDPNVAVYNPCAEQSLINKETCCLGIIFLPNIHNYEEFLECLGYCYRMCKHSLALHCSLKDTEEIVNKYMRMGIGLAGYLQASEEKKQWAEKAYEWLRQYDVEYSAKHGFPVSIKLTTSKPDGTQALLAGVTPGALVSPAPSQFYWRTIRIAASSPLVEVCRNSGYRMEYNLNFDGSTDHNTMVVYFPCRLADGVPHSGHVGWRDQLDTVRRVQREWSDNSVSNTITYNKEDIPEIKEYLNNHFRNEIKTVSFLLRHEHGFKQAPYIPITEEEYLIEAAKVKPITSLENIQDAFELTDCGNGACPVK
jgi:adenosylcobalamin-dependent ribonucleoside-triphosphate reductase